jgi:hypothetical protein
VIKNVDTPSNKRKKLFMKKKLFLFSFFFPCFSMMTKPCIGSDSSYLEHLTQAAEAIPVIRAHAKAVSIFHENDDKNPCQVVNASSFQNGVPWKNLLNHFIPEYQLILENKSSKISEDVTENTITQEQIDQINHDQIQIILKQISPPK